MKTIGLVGGVASGKSLVAQMLVDLGAGLLDADRTGHAVLAEDVEVHYALRERWGDAVFTTDGSVDRAEVARRVFSTSGTAELDRRFLENLLHPRIRRRLNQLRDQYAAAGKLAVVLDAPVLLEAGWGPMCNIVLMINASREQRLLRARQRGWTEAEFERREQAQWPIEDKRRAADFMINNDASEHELRQSVQEFWQNHIAISR
jgi:dephospho-CoA kinase